MMSDDAPALRLELWHAGSVTSESYRLAHACASTHADPHERGAADPRGSYRWLLLDERGAPLASRGYSTFFEEWQSTAVAQGDAGSAEFAETHTVPWQPGARCVIERRTRRGFETLWSIELPTHAPPAPAPPVRQTHRLHGPDSGTAAHFVFVAEGYAAGEAGLFLAQARRARDVLLATAPFAAHATRLRMTAVFVAAAASGIPPRPDAAPNGTAFSSAYGTLGMERYLVCQDLHALHRALDGLAWDSVIVLANANAYGGSGIFNSLAGVAAGMDDADFAYVLPHELGHSFGGLGDEYFGKHITYSMDDDTWATWEPNVSPLDEHGRVKWSDRVDPALPVPTPWRHSAFIELLQRVSEPQQQRASVQALLDSEPLRGRVGAFEGARYRATGMYRPEVDCRMFSKTARRFCRVCEQVLEACLARAARQSGR